MAYFNQVTNPKKQLVISLVYRPKGIILVTNDYDCFIYNDNKTAIGLKELLEFYKNNESEQRELWIHPNKQTKLGFKVEFGQPIHWYFYNSKASIDAETIDEEIDFVKELKKLNHPPSQQKKRGG